MNENLMKDTFEGISVTRRVTDGFINATDVLKYFNDRDGSNRRFKDFWENSGTKNHYNSLCLKHLKSTLHETSRGKGGATWMHEDLFLLFYNWINKIPNQSITRDELLFCDYIEESFDGILKFERQAKFGTYLVDLFCPLLKLCIEFDEDHHRKTNKVILDEERQKRIEDKYEVVFIRHVKGDNYSKTINKIIKWKMSYNIVQSIKDNKVPKLGLL